MNSIEQILGSIVAVSTTGYPLRNSTSLMTVPKTADDFKVGQALGLISGDWIYTCAHIQNTFSMIPGETDMFAAWCVNDPAITRGLFAGYYASTLDFMILSPNGMTVDMTEGGTETGLQMVGDFMEKYSTPILPARIEFPEDLDSTIINGFFIGADGKIIYRTKFKIWRNSANIEFYSDVFVMGGSGSPIFTDNNQFIGVTTVSSSQPDLNGMHHCIGKRIDQCMPKLLHDSIRWDVLNVLPQPDQPTGLDDPWARQKAAIDNVKWRQL
jgi:hypothetical protein